MALPEEANGKTIQKAGEMAPWLRALAMPGMVQSQADLCESKAST